MSKGVATPLKSGDMVVLSELPKLYSWKFYHENDYLAEQETRMKKEKEELEERISKEKLEKEKLEKEVKNQEARRELELEAERAMHAVQLEMLNEEKEKMAEEFKLKQEELEKKRKEMENEGGKGGKEEGIKEVLGSLEETLECQYQCPACFELFIR